MINFKEETLEVLKERRFDHTACEVLKIIEKTFNKVLGYDR